MTDHSATPQALENPTQTAAVTTSDEHIHLRVKEDDNDNPFTRPSTRTWMVSFTDLLALLLAFFVMMYSMKDPNMDKISSISGKAAAAGLHTGPGPKEAGGTQEGVQIKRVEYGEALDLDYLHGVLARVLKQAGLEDDVRIVTAPDHLKLVIKGDIFADGLAMNERGNKISRGLAQRLGLLSNRITVAGVPDRGDGETWDITLAEAAAFAKALQDSGYRRRFAVLGEGQGSDHAIEVRVEADDGRQVGG